jgi:hypothetical protein
VRGCTAVAFFLSVVLTALSLGGSWSHVLQIRGKAPWSGPFWRAAMETLYRDYAIIGGVTELAAIVAVWWLVFVLRGRSPAFGWALTAALLLTVAFLGIWLGFIAPINRVFATWTPETVPADWTSYRDRWELWHAVIATLKLGAFAALVVAVLKRS